jgi:hypothetical protein
MKELDNNLLNQFVQSILENGKEPKREPAAEPELPDDMKQLEEIKRVRYEALKEKYKD